MDDMQTVLTSLETLLDTIEQRADLVHHMGEQLEHACLFALAGDFNRDVEDARGLVIEMRSRLFKAAETEVRQ